MKPRFALALAFGSLACGCRHFCLDDRPVEPPRVEELRAGGVRVEDVFVGDGREATLGDIVELEYVAKLEDGTEVVSTITGGNPVEVTIGSAFVRGLDEGLVGIRANGRRSVVVPSYLAYGEEGVPGLIPANATLRFEIHALSIRAP